MRLYDIVVVLSPEIVPEQATALADGFKKILTDDAAQIKTEEIWGRRRLAYPIAKRREGIYYYWQVEAKAEAVAELERKLRLSDDVLRHLAVRADEELKRSVKLKKKREAKAAAKPKKAPAEPAAEPAEPAEA
ncbi:MAG TPA: 30S ribosomal protein S6 [Thermoanaerobaculia bacterium]|jgi:small subunit ribosomal protein S6|nr:30S ribosomal protein S6 [Thermoanaerobaculia bacterium]